MDKWLWTRWYPLSARKSADDHLAGLEKSYRTLERPDLALKALLVLTLRHGVVLSPQQLQRLAACLAQEEVTTRLRGWTVAEEDAALTSLLWYRKLFCDAGPPAVEPLRWLLAQPPLGAGPATLLQGMPHLDASRDRARIPMARDWPVRGAKLIALEVLAAQHVREALPDVVALATAGTEDPWTRCDAGLLALQWGGSEVADEVARGCVDGMLDRQGRVEWFEAYAARLAGAGDRLVPHLIVHLHDPDERRRRAAGAFLAAVGALAVPALVAVIDAGQNPDAMAAAAAVLAKVAPGEFRKQTSKLAAARARIEASERGISLTPDPGADPARGLSRLDRDSPESR